MKKISIRDIDLKKYKITINSKEINEKNDINNIVLDKNYNDLKIIQKNILDLYFDKSMIYKVIHGFFIAIIEGLGGTIIDKNIFEAGYSRAKYEAILIPKGNENLELNINLKQKKKIFIPYGKYYFEIETKNLELKNIISINEATIKDKISWIGMFSIPIIISILAIVLVLIYGIKLII